MAKDYSNIEGLIGNVKESIRNAYDKGYKQGCNEGYKQGSSLREIGFQHWYKKGLDAAWECARKICSMDYETRREALSVDDRHDLLGKILNAYSASEAIAKIKEYEEKQKQADDEIKVGDEVTESDWSGKGIVTRANEVCCYVMWGDGSSGSRGKDDLHKTGKHIDGLEKILEQLKEAQDETK